MSTLAAQSTATIKRKLAEEETAELARGVALNEMTASTYIATVIALEDQKYVVFDYHHVHNSSLTYHAGIYWTSRQERSISRSMKSPRFKSNTTNCFSVCVHWKAYRSATCEAKVSLSPSRVSNSLYNSYLVLMPCRRSGQAAHTVQGSRLGFDGFFVPIDVVEQD